MDCGNCGHENESDALYCAACGSELAELDDTRNCGSCGEMNDLSATFCRQCGQRLVTDRPQKKKKKKKNRKKQGLTPSQSTLSRPKLIARLLHSQPIYFVLGIVALGAILTIGREIIHSLRGVDRPRMTEQITNDPEVESVVLKVASKFICSCGTCGEQPLESCTCQTAVQERQFIRARAQAGQDPDVITTALALTYGWPKPEFASEVSELTAEAQPATPITPNEAATARGTNAMVPLAVATMFDRDEVFSHFTCPCGQCGIDELLYCDCSHPKGAREVKKYIDDLIRTNSKTVKDIVQNVDTKYGGRKF